MQELIHSTGSRALLVYQCYFFLYGVFKPTSASESPETVKGHVPGSHPQIFRFGSYEGGPGICITKCGPLALLYEILLEILLSVRQGSCLGTHPGQAQGVQCSRRTGWTPGRVTCSWPWEPPPGHARAAQCHPLWMDMQTDTTADLPKHTRGRKLPSNQASNTKRRLGGGSLHPPRCQVASGLPHRSHQSCDSFCAVGPSDHLVKPMGPEGCH